MYVNKLAMNGTQTHYQYVIKAMVNFYKDHIKKYIDANKKDGILNYLGLGIKSRCQTWLRQIPNMKGESATGAGLAMAVIFVGVQTHFSAKLSILKSRFALN
jgi:hypothetical protein